MYVASMYTPHDSGRQANGLQHPYCRVGHIELAEIRRWMAWLARSCPRGDGTGSACMGGAGVAKQAGTQRGPKRHEESHSRFSMEPGTNRQRCVMGFRYSCGARRVAVLVLAISSLPLVVARAQAVVRGVLYDDATGKPVSGAVMLVDPSSDAAVAHASADSTGIFSLQVGDGVYQIAAVRPGYKSVLSAPMSLQNGERLTVRVPIAQNGDPEHRIGVTEHIRPKTQGRSADATSEVQSRRALGMGLHYD